MFTSGDQIRRAIKYTLSQCLHNKVEVDVRYTTVPSLISRFNLGNNSDQFPSHLATKYPTLDRRRPNPSTGLHVVIADNLP